MQPISDDTKIPSDDIKISCLCRQVRTPLRGWTADTGYVSNVYNYRNNYTQQQ